MSSNNYNYGYYPTSSTTHNYRNEAQSLWRSEWSIEQQQYNDSNYIRSPPHTHVPSGSPHAATSPQPGGNQYYSNYRTSTSPQSNGRPYHPPRRQYNIQGQQQQYAQNAQQQNWNRNANYKRQRLDSDDLEPKTKTSKKKKKPLSQNVPSKKDWTMDDADKALSCEKEYNKRHKNQSLIIKFPDLELNKDIVSKFHGSIENVHFQQPSTARFCFVTLEESADSDAVIAALNQHKFGDGYLTAEYKKDREEDQNIGPEDIDPHTLYVGNLAQEITKEDMVKTYPKCKRIDIGYAKKMKYTRYAFVTFKSVTDSVEAFKKTHSTQMYSKSLIVRFRRLHGTVGMPGESKPQNPPKTINSDDVVITSDTVNTNGPTENNIGEENDDHERLELQNDEVSPPLVKTEQLPEFRTPFLPGSINKLFALHKPKQIKVEVKQENLTNPSLGAQKLLPSFLMGDLEEINDMESKMEDFNSELEVNQLTIQLSMDSESVNKLPLDSIEEFEDNLPTNNARKINSTETRLPQLDNNMETSLQLQNELILDNQSGAVNVLKIKEEINDNAESAVKSEPQDDEEDDDEDFGSMYQTMLVHAKNLSSLNKSRP